MRQYILRLDDACEKRNIANWDRMEALLDKYAIKPLVGVIPHCRDAAMDAYAADPDFWARARRWVDKGWVLGLHGYDHVYSSGDGGINPVNRRSEFAGLPLEEQKEKIAAGLAALRDHGIEPKFFFAPAHTFDENTLAALRECSDIRVISDTVANRPYSRAGFTFVPQQSGRVRPLPFALTTFCYHPNEMTDDGFGRLEAFIKKNCASFAPFPEETVERKRGLWDAVLSRIYFTIRELRKL